MKTFAEGAWTHSPKIIIGLDIGATESAVAFAYLHPGSSQHLHRVTAWPGQEAQKGEAKIPTLVYYDSMKTAVAFGAEARTPEIEEKAEDEQWQLARYFKLHLHPEAMKDKHNIRIEPLPMGVSLLTIYTDFMVYLLKHTKDFFETRIIDGKNIWSAYHEDMTVVLAHPNGWGVKEQKFMRQAVIAAKYVSSSKAISQVRFVSEAEASVHFCLLHGNLGNRLKPGINFVVCDSGGSTIDTTTYSVKATSPNLEIEEKKASACVQAGGIFVDSEFGEHLAQILTRANLDEETRRECLRKGVEDFKDFTKRMFDGAERQYRVDLGARRLRQDDLGIKRGTITLEAGVIKNHFDSSVMRAIESIREQMSGVECQHIFLVGGFGDSPYLRKSITEEFGNGRCSVYVGNESTAKAVAEGAVIWYSKLSVVSRVTRMAYGVDINEPYNPNDPTHYERRTYRHTAGYDYLTGKWSEIIGRGVIVSADTAVRETYWCSYRMANPILGNFKVTLYAFDGKGEPDPWLLDKHGKMNEGFKEVGKIEVDLRMMREALQHRTGPDGKYFYLLFTILFMFGRTELEALVEWEQEGETRTIPTRLTPVTLPSLS